MSGQRRPSSPERRRPVSKAVHTSAYLGLTAAGSGRERNPIGVKHFDLDSPRPPRCDDVSDVANQILSLKGLLERRADKTLLADQ